MKKFMTLLFIWFIVIGCGGGGHHHQASNPPSSPGGGQTPSYKLSGNSFISGFLKKKVNEGFAKLMLDVDNDGIYNGVNDKSYQVPLQNGAFRFEDIPVFQNKPLKAKLIVQVPNYAPYQKVLSLENGKSYTIDASAAINKPILKQVLKLDNLSQSAKLSSVVIFGIKKSGSTLESFAKLTTLSALANENNASFQNGAISTYTFPLSEVPDNVKLIEASMQAFDSTKKEDLQNFPGEFKGKTNQGEVGLKSAAFDYFVLRDQNGKIIHLKKSKFNANVDLSNCAHIWTRHVTLEENNTIMSWGDYNSSDPGYQVPIWSNDNAQNTWQFVGIANYYPDDLYFQVCVPDDWGTGYLNCDSPFMINRPKNICVNAIDNRGNPVDNLIITAHRNGAYYDAYSDSEGKATLQIPDNNLNSWQFSYKGDYTSWEEIAINSNNIYQSSIQGCDYELNVTVPNPYPADIKATIYLKNGQLAKHRYVSLEYEGENSYYEYFQSKKTNDKGEVYFSVDKNTPYLLTFRQESTKVNVNGQKEGNETIDTGSYVDVVLHEQNHPPLLEIGLANANVVKGKTQYIMPYIYASDSSDDTIVLNWIKLDGNAITLSNIQKVSENGYFYESGRYDINGLNEGNHTLSVKVSDNNGASITKNYIFQIRQNQAPIIEGPLVLERNNTLYYIKESGSFVKPGSYEIVYVNVYDKDGDDFSIKAIIDGSYGNLGNKFTLNKGSHTITIQAKDEFNNTSEKSYTFEAKNQKPIIVRAGALRGIINKRQSEIMHLFAYVKDPDGDGIKGVSLTITDLNNTNHVYPLYNKGSFWGRDFNISTYAPGVYKLQFLAQDNNNSLSEPYDVNISIINENTPPSIVPPLEDKTISTEQNATYTFTVIDMEGDRVNVECKLDNSVLNLTQNGNSYSVILSNLSEGNHTLSCSARDSQGAMSQSNATINVFNPNQQSVLIIHTTLPGVIVGIHNPNDQYALTKHVITDEFGNAVVNLASNTHNVSFSLTFSPQTILPKSFILEKAKNNIISEAHYNCHYNEEESNNTHCQSANWCNIVSSNTLATWVVDAAQLWIGDHKVTGSEFDDNNDSIITQDELYTHIIALMDSNGDGALNWNELKEEEYALETTLYKNMPVGEYDVEVGPYYEEEGLPEELQSCMQTQTLQFSLNINNLDENVTEITITGSNYENSSYLDHQTSYHTQIKALYPDRAGHYDFLVNIYKGLNNNIDKSKLFLDLTPNDLIDGLSLDYNTMQSENNKTVTIHLTPKTPIAQIYAYRNGLNINEVVFDVPQNEPEIANNENEMNLTMQVIDNNKLTYTLKLTNYDSGAHFEKWYEQEGYYGDGSLQSYYDTNNYPMLDIDADFNISKKAFDINGSEVAKVNSSAWGFEIENSDEEELWNFSIISFDSLTQQEVGFNDINVTKFYPSTIVSHISQMASSFKYSDIWFWAQELKGKNKNEAIAYWQNNKQKEYDWYELYQPWPYRDFYITKDIKTASMFKPSSDLKKANSVRKKPHFNPFLIRLPKIFH